MSMILFLAAGILAAPLGAGTFSVSPVRIQISLKRPFTIVQVSNLSDESTLIQAHVVSWGVRDNRDVYSRTDEILLNPPIFTVEPHQKQFIRLGMLRPIRETGEIAYRLILEEVPRPPRPGFSGLRTVLRISVPIFYNAEKAARPQIAWQAGPAQIGLRITALNRGATHVQIKSLEVVPDARNLTPLRQSCSEYILPGQFRTWMIDDEQLRTASRLKLVAVTDAGELHAILDTKTE
jgi:fimbrial chaperone protein